MTGHRDDDRPGTFASPACYMHEVDPAYAGLAALIQPLFGFALADVAQGVELA